MNESNINREGGTYQAVRIGDSADWRLICVMSGTGVGAWLKHEDPMRPVENILTVKWEKDESLLLGNIEDAVYDHPQVLDDFSADIVIVTPKTIWVPAGLVDDDEDESARLFRQVYEADDADIMSETVDDATALFTLTPGLSAFLQRTFPGARVHSHLAVMVRRFRERSAEMPRVYVDIRDGEADFCAFDRKNLIMAATHKWYSPEDIRYHIFNIINVFGLDPKNVQVSVSGPGSLKTPLVQELRKDVAFVMMTMLPTMGNSADLPLSASLLLRNRK